MGINYMSSSEYILAEADEKQMYEELAKLNRRAYNFSLTTNEYTLLVDFAATVKDVIKHVSRIEAGHLTVDDVFFEIKNDRDVRIIFPLNQFRQARWIQGKKGRDVTLEFEHYTWQLRELNL